MFEPSRLKAEFQPYPGFPGYSSVTIFKTSRMRIRFNNSCEKVRKISQYSRILHLVHTCIGKSGRMLFSRTMRQTDFRNRASRRLIWRERGSQGAIGFTDIRGVV